MLLVMRTVTSDLLTLPIKTRPVNSSSRLIVVQDVGLSLWPPDEVTLVLLSYLSVLLVLT